MERAQVVQQTVNGPCLWVHSVAYIVHAGCGVCRCSMEHSKEHCRQGDAPAPVSGNMRCPRCSSARAVQPVAAARVWSFASLGNAQLSIRTGCSCSTALPTAGCLHAQGYAPSASSPAAARSCPEVLRLLQLLTRSQCQ
jgi:hypothetical protein